MRSPVTRAVISTPTFSRVPTTTASRTRWLPRSRGSIRKPLVDANADKFEALGPTLDVSNTDFIRTSTDPRHAPAVIKLWSACAANGDIYRADYDGLYCIGCEQFYGANELADGLCPEHLTAPERVKESNYFFRLSRYRDYLRSLIEEDNLAIHPAQRKNEMLGFLDEPLEDLSISRSRTRARGWGIAVPGDPEQVIYVWFDALANYVSALGYATGDARFERYWHAADRVVHVIGKGVTRFHGIYWPAILRSAGLRTPTDLVVHGYITLDGQKISKSLGNVITPDTAAARFGADPLRYYLLRYVGSVRDGDFSWENYQRAYEHDLANQLGNLASRTLGLARRHGVPATTTSALAAELEGQIADHMAKFTVHRAVEAIWRVVESANAYVSQEAPWELAKQGDSGAYTAVMAELYGTLGVIADCLAPFLPSTSGRLARALTNTDPTPLFPRG